MEDLRELPDQSALTPANFTTLAHFSVSLAMNFPNSAGEPDNAVPPRSARRALNWGSARAALIDDLSGRVFRRADAGPEARLVVRHKFGNRRDVRQHRRACRSGHRQGAKLAAPDVFDR